jgi:branched-chain amino acid transport system permease protein
VSAATGKPWIRRLDAGPAVIGTLIVGALILVYPLIFTGPFPQHLMILVMLFALLGTAWNLIGGFAGQVSLGHAVFFGTGAYTSSVLLQQLGWSPWVGMAAGAVAAALLALAIGYPCFRLQGHYFSIATIAFAEIVQILVSNWEFAGAAVGLYLPITEGGLDELQFGTKRPYYYVMAALLAVGVALAAWLRHARPGYYWRAIREDQAAARSLGVPAFGYKQLAMALSAALTACAGTFYAQFVLFIDPPSVLPLSLSIQICLVAVLGGAGTVVGPLLGAAVLIPISEFTRVHLGATGRSLDLVVYGLLIMTIAAFEPAGLVGIWKRLTGRRAARAADRAMRVAGGLLLAGAVVLCPAAALAQRTGDVVVVRQPLADDLYAAGREVALEAPVAGDAVVAGRRVDVREAVGADLLAAAQTLTVTGHVADDVRVAGADITLAARIGGDVMAAGGRVVLAPEAIVRGGAALAGGDVRVEGRIARSLRAAGGRIRIAGTVEGDVDLAATTIQILPSAVIRGRLTYHSDRPAAIDPGARIGGDVTQHLEWRDTVDRTVTRARLLLRLAVWGGLALAALALLALLPGPSLGAARVIAAHPWRSLALGFALLVAVPAAAVLLMATVIGLPIGLAVLAIYPVALLAGVLVPLVGLGEAAVRAVRRERALAWRPLGVLLAVVLLALAAALPRVGGLAVLLVLVIGLGGLATEVFRAWRGRRAAAAPF